MVFSSAFKPSTVGLDIGSSAVRAVALKHGRAGWSLVAAGEAPTPDGGLEGGLTAQPVAVSEAIKQVMDDLKLRRARVASALSGHSVIVKRLLLPSMTQPELEEAIPWEAEQYIPFEISDVQLDYQIVTDPSDATKTSIDVLLVAAKRDRIDDRAAVIAQAGRQPIVIDIEAFALANAYEMNYPERNDPLTALIHVGRNSTIVCLLEKGHPVFTRDISLGGQLHFDALKRELESSGLEDAALMRLVHGQIPSDVSRDQVASVLREATEQIVGEVRKTIDFYRATAPVERLSRIMLSGGAWQAVGLVDLLGTEFGAPVDIFDPFRRVSKSSRSIGADVSGPAFAVAVGLAMRAEGDR
jgi:type IV pilus assembly protein PilM